MLTVKALGAGKAGYYLSLTETSYYTEAPEPEGRWYGLGTEEFGLKGTVKAEDLVQLCRGFDPRDPERHVRNAELQDGVPPNDKVPARKHGEDLCFSAPKSVSVAWALADPELRAAIERKLHRAVRDALDYVQEQCGWSRTGAQGQQLSRVPLTFALFEHCSSRLGDPQLHVHALCPNLTLRVDSRGKLRVTAIDSTHFYDIQKSAGALFRASLAEGMRELGFEVERDRFAFRLKGFSEELCERFSQRRAEIVEGILEAAKYVGKLSDLDVREVLAAARGRMAEIVTLSTRREKKEYTRAELFPIWREIAHESGVEPGYVRSLRGPARSLTPEEKLAEREAIFRTSLERVTDEFSHFAERDLTQIVAEEAQGRGLHARDVRELIEHKITGKEVLGLGEIVTKEKNQARNSFRERTEERYTTEDILKMEGVMLAEVGRMAKESAPVKPEIAEAAIERTAKKLAEAGHKFTDEQANAVRHLTAGNGLIACMTGKAGTGKSTTLETCRFAWELDRREVIGCAIQGKTAKGLQRTTGIQSSTLDSLLLRLENGRFTLTDRHVIVLDEAGMVPTKHMARLIALAEPVGAKVVCVGDGDQLQAVGAGGPFRSISDRLVNELGFAKCELTQIIRQRESWRRKTVEQFSRGEAREALTAYMVKGQLHVVKTREEAIQGLVERWQADHGVEKPEAVLLLASLNAEVRTLNRMCQERRKEAGQLGERRIFLGGDFMHEGDRVMLRKNSKALGVANGDTATILSVDEAAGKLAVRLDLDGRTVTLSAKEYGEKNFQLGYAMTVHKSQGETVEHCHVLMGGHMTNNLHLGYVQASRSRETTHLFVDVTHAGPDLRNVVRSLSKAAPKDLARDVLDRSRQLAEALAADRRQHQRQHAHDVSLGL